MKEPQKQFLVHHVRKKGPGPILGGATGKGDIHALGEAFSGTKSGRGVTSTKPRDITLRVSLAYELVYDDVVFVNPDDWEKYGIPNVFGEEQLVFYVKRDRNKIILCHKLNVMQIEARQK